MPHHYHLLKPRLNLGPSRTAHVAHAKYFLRILSEFARVCTGIHTSAYSSFLKKSRKSFKEHLEHLDFLHSWTYNSHKKIMLRVTKVITDQ